LHAPEASFRTRRLGTGSGHTEHHRDPGDLRWLLLTWRDAAIFAGGIGLITASWAAPLGLAFGSSPSRAALSAWTVGLIALAHYEWTHLLVHTRYRCRSRYYRALARHHRLHHYRNEQYWLGVTSRWGDRLLGTLPERGEVPSSPTARTLGATETVLG
jgi:sterol desaturase/sphingolipid hydroxylase (fatty acid hydroxylase superfamily)